MPYIKEQTDRFHYKVSETATTPGTLNYQITTTCLNYLNVAPKSYSRLNDIIGVLECVKQEFYRRVVVPYEEDQIRNNGDVF